ncbi:MAG: hypothetical protein FGF50_11055 [Candidatus Brockarchaeota archaeon]|nr:hypothetical protein [Candidatus Brockarchaeota archaeon]
MFSGMELLHVAFIAVFMLVFTIMMLFTLYMMFRALRSPRLYYPPPGPSASTLVKELMCPKCGSRELEPIGYCTIRCKSCGFIFSVGAPAVYPYHTGWLFWPMLWLPLFWFLPIIWLEKR